MAVRTEVGQVAAQLLRQVLNLDASLRILHVQLEFFPFDLALFVFVRDVFCHGRRLADDHTAFEERSVLSAAEFIQEMVEVCQLLRLGVELADNRQLQFAG